MAVKTTYPSRPLECLNLIEGLPESEFIGLTFPNKVDNHIEELVIPFNEFRERFKRNESKNLLVLWLTTDDQLYDVTNIGAEGEWFFVGGRMAKDTKMDLTKYLKKKN